MVLAYHFVDSRGDVDMKEATTKVACVVRIATAEFRSLKILRAQIFAKLWWRSTSEKRTSSCPFQVHVTGFIPYHHEQEHSCPGSDRSQLSYFCLVPILSM